MTKQTEFIPPFFDTRTLSGINPESRSYAESAYRTWCEVAGEIQSHTRQFLNNRLAKDQAAIADFVQCKTPIEVFNAQIAYARDAVADYVDEGQKVIAYFGNKATEGMLHGPFGHMRSAPEGKAARKSGHPPHHVAGH